MKRKNYKSPEMSFFVVEGQETVAASPVKIGVLDPSVTVTPYDDAGVIGEATFDDTEVFAH